MTNEHNDTADKRYASSKTALLLYSCLLENEFESQCRIHQLSTALNKDK